MEETLSKPYRYWIIWLEVKLHESDLWCATCPELPMFHVVGKTQEIMLENVQIILKQYLEFNYNIIINSLVMSPSYVIVKIES